MIFECVDNVFLKYGCTPLIMAAKESNLEMMSLLVQYGADIHKTDQVLLMMYEFGLFYKLFVDE